MSISEIQYRHAFMKANTDSTAGFGGERLMVEAGERAVQDGPPLTFLR
jgi:hypothetical protein